MLDVITFGEPLILFSPQSRGLLRHQTNFTKSVGGTELNTAIGLARLGISCGWFGRIGDDEFGSEVLAVLQAEGVDTSRVVRDSEHPTAVMFKQYRWIGDPQVFYYRSTSAARYLSPDAIDESYFAGARFLHLTGITATISNLSYMTVLKSVEVAKSLGVKISFDPNIRLRFMDVCTLDTLMMPIIRNSDVLFVGLEEGQLLFGVDKPEQIAVKAHAEGVHIVVVKMGKQGSYLSDLDSVFYQPCYDAPQIVDTVGAGDGYNAGFLSGLCRGESIQEAAVLASITGAFAVTVQSDYEGYPTREEMVSVREGQSRVTR
jgi:2-dehydro-3-deoxygluconokinase